ncbi:MAG: PTS sugar transporter subunit IIA [Planctomycetota bacterium]|jgi:mannitol/fructose-specific phosphotransferase system IIA component (Ntr-type)
MKLSELIDAEAVVSEIGAQSKEEAIRELVAALAAAGKVGKSEVDSLVAALMAREQLGSTGIGQGLAVPHAKHENVSELVAAFGRSKSGVEFDSLDGEPVYLFFLLLSNKEASGMHLEALAYITKLLRDDLFCRFLRDAKDAGEILDLLREADEKLASVS